MTTVPTTPRPPPVGPHRMLVRATPVAGDSARVLVTASTAEPARDGHILRQNWRLDAYRANPVVPWSHHYWEPPIGRAVEVDVRNGALQAVIEWDTEDEMGAIVARKFARGFLSAVSVSWIPGQAIPRDSLEPDDPEYARDGCIFDDNELTEISAVVVPADANAVVARSLGEPWPMRATGARRRRPSIAVVGELLRTDPALVRAPLLELLRTDPEVRRALLAVPLTVPAPRHAPPPACPSSDDDPVAVALGVLRHQES